MGFENKQHKDIELIDYQTSANIGLPKKAVQQPDFNFPLLIVENLPKTFGKIDKNDSKKLQKISNEERILLNLIARIIVEIFIKEEL